MDITRRRRQVGFSFVLTATALTVGLAWFSLQMVQLEHKEWQGRCEASRLRTVNDALDRMDAWLSALIAQEASRRPDEYSSFRLEPNSIPVVGDQSPQAAMNPSRLLSFRSDYFQLHFECAFQPTIPTCSPQVPVEPAQQRMALSNGLLSIGEFDRNQSRLAHVAEILEDPTVLPRFEVEEARVLAMLGQQRPPVREVTIEGQNLEQWRTRATRNLQALGQASTYANIALPTAKRAIGPLIPIWVNNSKDSDRGPELLFLRRVDERYQGILTDWPRLESALLEQLQIVADKASLEPLNISDAGASRTGDLLATIPARLRLENVEFDQPHPPTLMRADLLVAWVAMALALVLGGMSLRAMVGFLEKRERFTSAVTHELRTPLTTFQLYSEMLADGMVTDPVRRQEYLESLKLESRRLSSLVENVLAYARLESGHSTVRTREITVGELVTLVRPELESRSIETGTLLAWEVRDPSVALVTDPDAVAQILLNLFDNAAKYGDDTAVQVRFESSARGVQVELRDHGPGLPGGDLNAPFRPFERCGRESTSTPGVGLGLALSRELARDLGGELRAREVECGACFVLELGRKNRA